MEELLTRGCQAAGYRLSGAVVDHVCCRHLYGSDRMLTAWRGEEEAVVLLVGPHDRGALDVYDRLLAALGLESVEAERDKPACCGPDEAPPTDPELGSSIVAAVEAVARHPRRRRRS